MTCDSQQCYFSSRFNVLSIAEPLLVSSLVIGSSFKSLKGACHKMGSQVRDAWHIQNGWIFTPGSHQGHPGRQTGKDQTCVWEKKPRLISQKITFLYYVPILWVHRMDPPPLSLHHQIDVKHPLSFPAHWFGHLIRLRQITTPLEIQGFSLDF